MPGEFSSSKRTRFSLLLLVGRSQDLLDAGSWIGDKMSTLHVLWASSCSGVAVFQSVQGGECTSRLLSGTAARASKDALISGANVLFLRCSKFCRRALAAKIAKFSLTLRRPFVRQLGLDTSQVLFEESFR